MKKNTADSADSKTDDENRHQSPPVENTPPGTAEKKDEQLSDGSGGAFSATEEVDIDTPEEDQQEGSAY